MPVQIFKLLPYIVVLSGTIGLAMGAVGMWRFFFKCSLGLRVASAGMVLLLVCLVSWSQYRASGQGRLDSCKSLLGKSVATALEMYVQDEGKLPGSLRELTPTYLKSVPVCPAAGRDTYSGGYQILRLQDDGYVLACSGYNHPGLTLPDHPAYHSVEGMIEP